MLVVLAVPELEADEGEVGGGVIGAEAAGAGTLGELLAQQLFELKAMVELELDFLF